MKKNKNLPPDLSELRRRAIEQMKAQGTDKDSICADNYSLRMLHELQVHQIELEMQNEALQQLQANLEESLQQYIDIHDFTPVGYFTLDRQSSIRQANLTGAQFLNMDRSLLMNRRFGFFVSPETQPTFNAFLDSAFVSRQKESCEVVLLPEMGAPTAVRMEVVVARDSDECHIVAVDITKRKKADEVLKESEEKHRLLIDNSHDIIYTLSAKGVFTFVSPAWTAILGHPVTQVAGQSFQQFVHPDDLAECMIFLNAVLETGKRQGGVEYRVRHTDGSWRWHTSSAVPLKDEDGKVIGFEGIARDITERKNADETLAQTRRNYETFFNTIDEFLFVLDEQGGIIHTNTTVIERLGYTSEELTGKSVLMVHPPERRDEAGRIVGEMLSGAAEYCPVPIITKSGVQIPVETRVSTGFWDGKPALFGVTKDISAIKLSEEKFSMLFRMNPSACGLSDFDNHKYVELNDAFYNLLGFDRSEVIGRTALDLGIITTEQANAIFLKADSKGGITNAEADLRAKNGDVKHVLLSAENIVVQDKIYRFTIVNDITERKLAEDALRRYAEREHHIAEVLQQAVMPAKLPIQPTGYEITARYQPALQEADVCGDFCDIFDLGDGRIGITIGDVTGKGLSAALRVSAARNAIRCYAFIDNRPSSVMSLVNDVLCRNIVTERDMMTAFFAVLDTGTGLITYCNAGHVPPLVWHSESAEYLTDGGPMFIGMSKQTYLESAVRLNAGDTMVLVTDGITEASIDIRSEMFGVGGIEHSLSRNAGLSAEQITDGIQKDAESFAGGRLRDDVTILVIKKL